MSTHQAALIFGVLVTAAAASAEDVAPTGPLPHGVLTSPNHSDAWKIENALSAGPPAITERATVMDWPSDPKAGAGRILRQGDNGWTCMPDLAAKPAHDPMCADATMMKWMMARARGEEPNIDRVGIAYMLQGEAGADQNDPSAKVPPKGKEWYYVGPHVMIVLPNADKAALGAINRDIAKNQPYVTALSSPSPLLVVPIAKPGESLAVKKPNETP
jgi:hypothetical protein